MMERYDMENWAIGEKGLVGKTSDKKLIVNWGKQTKVGKGLAFMLSFCS